MKSFFMLSYFRFTMMSMMKSDSSYLWDYIPDYSLFGIWFIKMQWFFSHFSSFILWSDKGLSSGQLQKPNPFLHFLVSQNHKFLSIQNIKLVNSIGRIRKCCWSSFTWNENRNLCESNGKSFQFPFSLFIVIILRGNEWEYTWNWIERL